MNIASIPFKLRPRARLRERVLSALDCLYAAMKLKHESQVMLDTLRSLEKSGRVDLGTCRRARVILLQAKLAGVRETQRRLERLKR